MNQLKKIKIIFSILLILISGYILLDNELKHQQEQQNEQELIEEYYEREVIDETIPSTDATEIVEEVKEQINYIAVLKIPKIDLVKGLVDRNSYFNNVNYNIQILDSSDMPDKENGNIILASHTGTSKVAFFRHIDRLVIGDEIILDYKNKTYTYKITDIYDIEKTGKAYIKRNKDINTLTLISCRFRTNKQIIIISELMMKEE
ncbi:MAG: sortase [Bacilli bacterium]|nr:sortase [Bacilli bacterium]